MKQFTKSQKLAITAANKAFQRLKKEGLGVGAMDDKLLVCRMEQYQELFRLHKCPYEAITDICNKMDDNYENIYPYCSLETRGVFLGSGGW